MARLLWTHGTGVQGMGGRRARAARGRADPRRAQGRASARTAATSRCSRTASGSTPPRSTRRPELLKEPYRHWIDLARRRAGRRADRDRGLGRRREGRDRHRARASSTPSRRSSIWTADYAASRLGWKNRDPLWVLALRVHRLLEPVTVPWGDGYGGCTSWVDLDGLPDDPASLPSEPALSDVAFEAPAQGRGRRAPRAHRPGVE